MANLNSTEPLAIRDCPLKNLQPRATGRWDDDCTAGRKFALAATLAIKLNDNPMLMERAITMVVADDDGIKAGFMNMLAQLAVRGLAS